MQLFYDPGGSLVQGIKDWLTVVGFAFGRYPPRPMYVSGLIKVGRRLPFAASQPSL